MLRRLLLLTSAATVAAVLSACGLPGGGSGGSTGPFLTVPDGLSTDEDVSLDFTVSVVDADAPTLRMRLQVTNGTLTLHQTTGLTFQTGDGTEDADMRFTGTVAAINAAMDPLTFSPDENEDGSANLSVTATDEHGGSTSTVSQGTSIDIVAINDAPTVSDVPGANAAQNAWSAFGPIVVADVDADAGDDLEVTLSIGGGPLFVDDHRLERQLRRRGPRRHQRKPALPGDDLGDQRRARHPHLRRFRRVPGPHVHHHR